ncbi:hypothetical protein LCGC14_2992190, partial [marine sediment metagenome]
HTLIQKVAETQIQKDKKSDIQISESFTIKAGGLEGNAQRTLTTNSTITNRIDRMITLIQKDEDGDGFLDTEITFEEVYYTTDTIVYSEEVTDISFKVSSIKTESGTLTEYRNSTYHIFDMSTSYMFRDFENDLPVSIRYYDDVFPNQLSEIYNMDNNLQTVTNENDDEDPTNDIIAQAPALENILGFTHPEDGVSAIYDRIIEINRDTPYTANNILTVEKEITIPGTYNDDSGIADYMGDKQITMEVIEVIPPDGAYYDNMEGYVPKKYVGFSYYYFDEDGDGQASVIFIVDISGNVRGIGIDYDGNAYFEPDKLLFVEKHSISRMPSIAKYEMKTLLKFADHKYVNYDKDKSDEFTLEITFRDSL